MSLSIREQLHESAKHVASLGDIDQAITTGVHRRYRTYAVAAAAAGTACVVILAAIFLGAAPGDPQPGPVQPPTPTSDSNIRGWPGPSRNPPGIYSFNGIVCGSSPSGLVPDTTPFSGCFMHNGYGSGDVEIRISVGPGQVIPGDGGTVVVVAGHDGVHRQITARQEDWTVDIDGTPVAINLKAASGTSQADLDEAHAIIDSMYTETTESGQGVGERDLGFRLVFTLTTNDWDSG
jgi:hypothetical protein